MLQAKQKKSELCLLTFALDSRSRSEAVQAAGGRLSTSRAGRTAGPNRAPGEEEECSEGHESGSMQVCGPHATVVRLSFLLVRKLCVSGAFRFAPSLLAEQHKLLMSVRGCCSLQVTFLVPPRTFSRWILA